MASFGFISFILSCMLFQCEGGIISPAKGTEFVFLFGSTVNITWIFDDAISSLFLRSWLFTRRGGSTPERLATIISNNDPDIPKSSLSGVEIVKPGTLLLKNVNQSHNGIYEFELTASGPAVASDVVVFIAKKPTVTFSCSPSPITVDEGDNFTCVCRGEGGNPPANVTWYKDGGQISETGKKNQTLTLVDVNVTNSGTYKCEARSHTNDSFADEKSIKLIVRQLTEPNITSFTVTPDSVAKEGQKVTITCISKGVPYPNNDIFRNGTKVYTEKTTSTEVSTEETSTTYTIDSVTPGDAGIYTCIAKNKVGNDSATVNLTVQGTITPTRTISAPTASHSATSSIASNGTVQACSNDTSSGTEWYIVVVILVSGIIIGLFLAYIVWCSRRRWFRNRKPERNPEPQTTEADTTYQELDLSKMKAEDNYQSLRVNAACIDAGNDDDSTYTELKKGGRDDENNYQSLT